MKDKFDLSKCKTFEELKGIIDDWMDYYNNERYQWNLSKLSQSNIINILQQENIL